MWKILQQKKPDDFVISTGKQYTIKQFVNKVADRLKLKLKWVGTGLKEKAIDKNTNKIIIELDKKYFRPLDVENLIGDSNKARKILKWKPKYNIDSLIDDMIYHQLKND